MTREEQDKLWAELSEESKKEMKAKYAEFSAKNNTESKGYCKGMANVFGEHNLIYLELRRMWIARNEDGKLYLHYDYPTRYSGNYQPDFCHQGHFQSSGTSMRIESDAFPEVTWGNSPVEAELKLTKNKSTD